MSLTTDFRARFTVAEFTDAQVNLYMPILEPVYPAYYAAEYTGSTKEATLNLLAHLMVFEIDTAPNATTFANSTSISVGSVSVSGAAPDQHAWLSATKYGQRFLAIIEPDTGGFFI